MRSRTGVYLLLVGAAMLLSAACIGEVLIKRCPIRDQGGDRSNLTYEGYIPEQCPIPYTTSGDPFNPGFPNAKEAGVNLSSPIPAFYRAYATVRNSRGENKIVTDMYANHYDVAFAYNEFTNRNEAKLLATYFAATNWDGSYQADGRLSTSGNDLATFTAYRDDLRQNPYADVELNYKPSNVRTSVTGPDLPLAGSAGTWSATASGGSSPYTYRWYRNGEFVGGSSDYSASGFTSAFGLRMVVVDQYNNSTHADFWVDVDGVRASVNGPTLSYASSGGGTWTAVPRGGYPPYTVDWYATPSGYGRTYLGSGMSYSGYPGEGSVRLEALVQDSHGRSIDVFRLVTGIGDPNGGCAPEPPALTCPP